DEFHRKQIIQYRKMIQAGLGQYFGAFLEGKLVGSLGLFRDKEVGRFQIVGTDPNFQRRGVCSSLVYHSAKYGFQKMGLSTLVMVADEAYHAAKIYESVGFKPTQKQIGLCWYDKERT
ncbi:MAG: ribosomal protein S18 acetylase RimI-like enzyme, partial [Thermoproteota archaeon]